MIIIIIFFVKLICCPKNKLNEKFLDEINYQFNVYVLLFLILFNIIYIILMININNINSNIYIYIFFFLKKKKKKKTIINCNTIKLE